MIFTLSDSSNTLLLFLFLVDRDCQAAELQKSLLPRAPERKRGTVTAVPDRGYFCVSLPPPRLISHYRAHPEEIVIVDNFDYYSPDNCPDHLDSDDSDSTVDDDLDYEYAKLGYF